MLFSAKYVFYVIFVFLLFAIPLVFEYIIFKQRSKQKKKVEYKIWKNLLQKYGLTKLGFKDILYGFLLGALLLGINLLFIGTISLFVKESAPNITLKLAKNFALNPVFYIAYFLVLAIAEEFFFRAFLTTYTGIWFSSLIFALLHFSYGSFLEIVGAFILGLILAFVWVKKRNFYIISLAHFIQNMCAVLVIIWLL